MRTETERELDDEDDWLDEAPRKRGGIPGWAKFCGCGCLLALALVVTLALVIVGEIRRGLDDELQWAELGKVLPYDARPEELTLVVGVRRLAPFFLLNDERGYMWIVRAQEEDGALYRESIFGAESEFLDPILNFQSVSGEESSTVVLQGRELPVKRFLQSGAPILELATQGQRVDGQSALIDVTPEGSNGMVVVFLVDVDAEEPISDDVLRELLAPFHVGPERELYVLPPPEAEAPPLEPAPGEEDR